MTRKKRSSGHGSAAQGSTAGGGSNAQASHVAASYSTSADAAMEERGFTFHDVVSHYQTLASSISSYTQRLDRLFWLHNVVLLILHNVVMYDQDAAREQFALLIWTGVWIGRGLIIQLEAVSGIASSYRLRTWLVRRVAVSAICIIVFMPFFYWRRDEVEGEVSWRLAVLGMLELAIVESFRRSKGQDTKVSSILSVIDTIFSIQVFSTTLNHKEFLIYDEAVVNLVALSVVIQNCVYLCIKWIMGSTDHESVAQRTRKRNMKALEELRERLERQDPISGATHDTASTNSKRKKKAKQAKAAKLAPTSEPSETAGPTSIAIWSLLESCSTRLTEYLPTTRIRLTTVLMVQTLLVLFQVAASFVCHSFESMSCLMLSSSHLLYLLLQLQDDMLAEVPLQGAPSPEDIDEVDSQEEQTSLS